METDMLTNLNTYTKLKYFFNTILLHFLEYALFAAYIKDSNKYFKFI